MDVDAYLERIGYAGPRVPTLATLRALHVAHMYAVPFENLDIHAVPRRPIVLDEALLYDKIVARRRGGFCYELNGLFAWLLRRLGFDVTMLSAGVAHSDGTPGPEFDHLTLLVTVDGARWLADVGFGDSSLEPLPVDAPPDPATRHRVTPGWAMEAIDEFGRWTAEYRFTLTLRSLSEFTAMCEYHQTSPDSHFTRNRICSLARPDGRVSLSGSKLIIRDASGRNETELADEAAVTAALRQHFDVIV